MSTEIYYFTGTGNSLAVARKVAELAGGTLIPIAALRNEAEIATEADVVGVVFPCYLAQISGVPLIVERFLGKLKVPKGAYVFSLCTYGGWGPVNGVPTYISMNRIAGTNGLEISAHFSIKLPMNNLDYDHVPVPINRDHEKMFAYTDGKIRNMHERIVRKERRNPAIRLGLYAIVTKPLFSLLRRYVIASLAERAQADREEECDFRDLIHRSDAGIRVDDGCTGCGICVKLCPVGNIRLVGGKPEWLHRCEACLACDEWCPHRAIHHWAKTDGKNYHHPNVTLKDMLGQSGAVVR